MKNKKKKQPLLKRLLAWIIQGNEKAAREGKFCPS